MKCIILFSFRLILASILCGCSTDSVIQGIPDREIIHYTELPRPFTQLTFFSYEYPDAKPVLDRLLKGGFPVAEAWNATGEWECPLRIPTFPQLIIRLDSPAPRIFEFGFSSDSTRLQIYGVTAGCKPNWEHYQIRK